MGGPFRTNRRSGEGNERTLGKVACGGVDLDQLLEASLQLRPGGGPWAVETHVRDVSILREDVHHAARPRAGGNHARGDWLLPGRGPHHLQAGEEPLAQHGATQPPCFSPLTEPIKAQTSL